jgi:hypothetical protein
MERPDSRLLRIVNGRVVGEGTANATTRSKWKAGKVEKTGEGSGRNSTMEIEEQAPTTPTPTEIDENNDENNDEEMGMVRQDNGKGSEMDAEKERAKKEWLSWYSRDLILPEGEQPDDYMTGVIRVVDGKQYQLDDYEKLGIYPSGNQHLSRRIGQPQRTTYTIQTARL